MDAAVRGRVDYLPTYEAMQAFTAQRDDDDARRTLAVRAPAGLHAGPGGQGPTTCSMPAASRWLRPTAAARSPTTGPGQVVAYPLVDLRRAGYFVKEYVYRIEEAVIRTLAYFGVTGHRVAGAPGIYVRLDDPFSHLALTGPALPDEPFEGLGKIAALGIKVSRHCTYHGVALNVAWTWNPSPASTLAAMPG